MSHDPIPFVGDNDHGDALPGAEILFGEVLKLRKEIEQLRAERDDARRSYCYATGNGEEQRAINIAQSKGWDCFRENSDG